MPIVRRKITAPVESTYGSQEIEHEHYVKPTQVQKGDVVVEPKDLPDSMLADLAISHPKEFRAAALERDLVKLDEDDEEDAHPGSDEDELTFTAEQVKFLTAPAAEAVAMIDTAAAAQDLDTLAAYAIAEEAKEKPRKSVLEALARVFA